MRTFGRMTCTISSISEYITRKEKKPNNERILATLCVTVFGVPFFEPVTLWTIYEPTLSRDRVKENRRQSIKFIQVYYYDL